MECKRRVCVLEDNDDIREIIEFLLESEHYEVFSYATVKAFLKDALLNKPDIFVLDVMLPDGNGIEVCKKLKSDLNSSAIPVIMMSANYSESDVRGSLSANDFIKKPFDIGDFVDRIGIQLGDQFIANITTAH
jgi:two-component system phosphate regulon response regulator PhoB